MDFLNSLNSFEKSLLNEYRPKFKYERSVIFCNLGIIRKDNKIIIIPMSVFIFEDNLEIESI